MKIILDQDASRFTGRFVWKKNGLFRKNRYPKHRVHTYSMRKFGFFAAGKYYRSLKEVERTSFEKEGLEFFKDCYERTWLYVWKRFPCFDSYDAVNENRYYNYYILITRRKVYCIYKEDGNPEVIVVSDVYELLMDCCLKMERAGWFDMDW